MPLHDLDTFVDQELGGIGLGGGAAVPSAWTTATGFLCGLEDRFGIGMGNPSAGVFGRTVPAGPDIVRHLGYRRDTKNGVMWVHGSKGNSCLCQTVAGAARLLFRSGTGGTGGMFGIGPIIIFQTLGKQNTTVESARTPKMHQKTVLYIRACLTSAGVISSMSMTMGESMDFQSLSIRPRISLWSLMMLLDSLLLMEILF